MNDQQLSEDELCKKAFVMAIRDSLNVVSGKWKLAIICTLLRGPRRFNEIERLLNGLSPRMLARELRELEVNGVVKRIVIEGDDSDLKSPSSPVKGKPFHYQLTQSGQNLESIIISMAEWGVKHRLLISETDEQAGR